MALAHGVNITAESTTHADYVRIVCTGEFAMNDALTIFAQSFEEAAEAGREAVLVDGRQVTGREPTMAERYEIAVCVAQVQAAHKPRIRLAVLGNEPMVHPERFGEIVATNRGAVMRVFTDEVLALDWLLGKNRES